MRTHSRNERLLIATLSTWEASGELEPGMARAAKAALRDVRKATTRRQRHRAVDKLAGIFLRKDPKNRSERRGE